jgi:hypothetical protein
MCRQTLYGEAFPRLLSCGEESGLAPASLLYATPPRVKYRGPVCNARAPGQKRPVPLYEFQLREGDKIISTGTFWNDSSLEPGDVVDWLPVLGTVREKVPADQPGTFRLIVDVMPQAP